ncbi:hypothetical protein BURMUCGD2M_3794 [Burkholderia multivorans CGD2M]|nr:hypothetical protein BURMUCGD2M_3794 [Burkholderia multivorans CGD2M]
MKKGGAFYAATTLETEVIDPGTAANTAALEGKTLSGRETRDRFYRNVLIRS